MKRLSCYFLTGAMFILTPKAHASSAEQCFAAYNQLTATAISSARELRQMDGIYPKLISQWQQQEGICQGTGIYEARLVQLHILNSDYPQAQAVLDNTKPSGEYGRYLELAALWLEYSKLALDSDTTGLLAQLKTLTGKYPDFDEAHGLYGFVLTMAQQPAEAIAALKKSLTSPVDLYDHYKALMINYVNLQQYAAANEMLNEAYNLNPAFSSDPEAMFVAIKISLELKDYKTVGNIFKVLNARLPEAMQHEGFQQLYQEYQTALK
jgi:tetratricopeptide (TPR) repeat protein